MAKGRFSNDLPQSGLPGLRFRRDTQMWVVSLPVPTSLRASLKNTRGKPLTRLERSTGERDEGRARRSYPKLLAQLEAELHQKSKDTGLNTTTQEAVEKALGKIYKEVVSDEQSLLTVTKLHQQLKTKSGQPSPDSEPKNRLNIDQVASNSHSKLQWQPKSGCWSPENSSSAKA